MLVPLIFKFSLGAFYRDDEAEARILISKSQWLVGNGRTALSGCPNHWKTKTANGNPAARFPRSMWNSTGRLASLKCSHKKSSRLNDEGLEHSEGILPVQTDVLHQGGELF